LPLTVVTETHIPLSIRLNAPSQRREV
jgi:hypothetical protein